MREPSHSLNRRLPPDMAAGESAFIQFYQQYVAFSWPWAWRRTLVFGLLGLLAGALFGASHGLHARDFGEGVIVTLASTTANLFLVGAGPMLAAVVRHWSWPLRLERTLIVAAVIVGMVLGVVTDDWASGVHDDYMAAHGSASQDSDLQGSDMHSVMRELLDLAPNLL